MVYLTVIHRVELFWAVCLASDFPSVSKMEGWQVPIPVNRS